MENILLMITLMICLVTDIKKRKIYNKVLVPALTIGLLIHLWTGGWVGIKEALVGFIVGLCILLIPFLLGGIGAGDVKLLATIGAIKGATFALYTGIWMGLAGGVIAIGILLYQRELLSTVKSIGQGLKLMMISGFKIISFDNNVENNMFPYGLAITIGAIMAFIIVG
ncbi:prepilin peptidase CpaA [Natronincola peptidivorans]|uniref:Prepilin peptidase CpaA n=1 Tax=Natronincola peptidivorans TaxID=426128 RepID=A0A1I0FQL8_9FIRM|nr:prepilin peptidase [Natronincola peptidivorans]SET59820.1 prepilin peptidase CpaA [Natronincola peptidivorans]